MSTRGPKGGKPNRKLLKRFPLDWKIIPRKVYLTVIQDFDKTRPFLAMEAFDRDLYVEYYYDSLSKKRKLEFIPFRKSYLNALTPARQRRLIGFVLNQEFENGTLQKKVYTRRQRRRTPMGGKLSFSTSFIVFADYFKPFPRSKLQQDNFIRARELSLEGTHLAMKEKWGYNHPIQCRNYVGLGGARCKNRFEHSCYYTGGFIKGTQVPIKTNRRKYCDSCRTIRHTFRNMMRKQKKATKLREAKASRERYLKKKGDRPYPYKTIAGWTKANIELARTDPEEYLAQLMVKINSGELK